MRRAHSCASFFLLDFLVLSCFQLSSARARFPAAPVLLFSFFLSILPVSRLVFFQLAENFFTSRSSAHDKNDE